MQSFCDVLRNEFADDASTNIHVCFPPDMDTPGYHEELKTKPIEQRQVWPEIFNELFKPGDVARDLLRGVQKGHYHVRSPDAFANLLVSRAWGHYPRGIWYGLVDFFLAPRFSSGTLSSLGVSILTQPGFLFLEFSKESEPFLGKRRFPLCGSRHCGPSARSPTLVTGRDDA